MRDIGGRKFTLMWVDGVCETPKLEQFKTELGPGGGVSYPDRANSLIEEYGAKLSWDDEREWYE